MKTNERHIMAAPVTRLAKDLEQKFFRMERANSWQAAVVNGVIAGSAVALVAWLMTSPEEGDLLLFACLGSSAASVVFAPLAKANSLRTIVSAYIIASIVCVLVYPLHKHQWVGMPVQCFLAVALPITLMRLIDAMHPAAIGSSLAFIIYDRPPQVLGLLLLAIVGLLTVVKVLAYIYLEDLTFRKFPREFRRDYYGQEMLVTITEDSKSPQHANTSAADSLE
ncbi:HPP family protein [Fuerstiella marisgermanici]|uniref:HPP family protein n=1 Tax=Fuerstiella marisgermanici TaxID=1891926 RepID=A0A1P8W9Z9_9PLAN|nr:HPP family protein [Fuerstiella marisgermanici]APZ90879.1 HPP family protein [Fuerstiella marisgermanici]